MATAPNTNQLSIVCPKILALPLLRFLMSNNHMLKLKYHHPFKLSSSPPNFEKKVGETLGVILQLKFVIFFN